MGDRKNWEGGYIRRDTKGRDVFVIERWVAGRKFHVSTRCHSRKSAHHQLERFEADPAAYRPDGDEGLPISAELVEGFMDHLVKQRKTSGRYAREMARHLRDWAIDLKGKSLRSLQLSDLRAPLERRPSRQHRVIAIKGFGRWLRQDRGLLKTSQDVSLEIPVPQATPEKHVRRKVIEIERIAGAFGKLEGAPRDVLLVLSATGMHTTELERFCRGHESAALIDGDPAVLIVRHKSGEATRIPLAIPEVIAAAKRLRAGGVFPRKMNQQVKEACLAAGVKPFTLGPIRHTVGTFAVEAGAEAGVVSKFLGHLDQKTTERFYLDLQRPTAGVPVPALRLVSGK